MTHECVHKMSCGADSEYAVLDLRAIVTCLDSRSLLLLDISLDRACALRLGSASRS